MNHPPTLAYLAFAFSQDPTGCTKKAREMAITIMKEHPDWTVIVPHYTVDALLDGIVNWDKNMKFSKWRRGQGAIMCLAILSHIDILILGCEPEYSSSSGVTWEWTHARLLNQSYRKDNPIEIFSIKDLIGEKRYNEIMEG
jgi:hypothetical protein